MQVKNPSPVYLPILYWYMSIFTAHNTSRQRSLAAVSTDRLGGSLWKVPVSISLLALIVYFSHHIFSTLQTEPVESPTSLPSNINRAGYFSIWCWRSNLIHMQQSFQELFHVCDSSPTRTDSLNAVWALCATCLFGLQYKIDKRKH